MNHHILIIGAGGMARAMAYDLLTHEPRHPVVVLDRDQIALNNLSEFIGKTTGDAGDTLRTVCGDASDLELLKRLMSNASSAIGAASYKLHYEASKMAIYEGCHWVDLGGNPTVVQKQFELHKQAVAAGVGVVPDSGLAPGLINVVGGAIVSRLDEVQELHFRVGGLPQNPKPPLFYGLVFSPEGLANEYHEPAWVIEDGKVKTVESLTGWERIYFGAPMGTLEAFHTSGGASTMVETFAGKVKALDYKTLRYPGHLRKIKLLGDLGFWGEEELNLECRMKNAECRIAPRDVLGALLIRQGFVTEDLVALMGWGIGTKDRKAARVEIKMLDYTDKETGLSAMARTTGFPAVIVARMLAEGRIKETGVLRQEVSVPAAEAFRELGKRGVKIEIIAR